MTKPGGSTLTSSIPSSPATARVPRGAKGWYHSKYAVTDGVTAGWYRKMYYLNYLSGAGAVFWEQGLENQWLLPGPGKHRVQLSPFGRGTEDFQAFTSRVPDRGEALAFACSLAQPGDVVIACGKGHEQSMCFGTVEFPWDDRDALRAALRGQPLKTLPTA